MNKRFIEFNKKLDDSDYTYNNMAREIKGLVVRSIQFFLITSSILGVETEPQVKSLIGSTQWSKWKGY